MGLPNLDQTAKHSGQFPDGEPQFELDQASIVDFALVGFLSFALCFSHIWQGTLGIDSIRYASIARMIVESGELLPLFDPYTNSLYANKPPLLFWLTAFSFSLFGYSTFAAKFVGALFASCAICALWLLTAGVWGRRAAYLAVALLICSPIFFRAVVDLNFEAIILLGSILGLLGLVRVVVARVAMTADLFLLGISGMLMLATKPPYLLFVLLPLVSVGVRVPQIITFRQLLVVGLLWSCGLFWLPLLGDLGYFQTAIENQVIEPFLLTTSFSENLRRWIELAALHYAPVVIAGVYVFLTLRGRALAEETKLLLFWALPILPIVCLATVRSRYLMPPAIAVLLLGAKELSLVLPALRITTLRRLAAVITLVVSVISVSNNPSLHKTDQFVALFRERPELLSEQSLLCVSSGERGDIESPTQRRLELLLDFEFRRQPVVFGALTMPPEVSQGAPFLAAKNCLELISGKSEVLERYSQGIVRVRLDSLPQPL